MLNITLQPEIVARAWGFPISNTLLTSVIVSALLIVAAGLARPRRDGAPNRFLGLFLREILSLCDAVTGDRALSKRILPLIATFFLFIVTANLVALVPGFLGSFYVSTPTGRLSLLRSPDSDLNTTAALALVSVAATQAFSLGALGLKKYLARFLNLKSVLGFFIGFLDIISEAAKVLSFSFRLFGNVFAGEILLLIIAFLVPYVLPVPFMILEVFVGVIQAFIFAVLTLTFIKTGMVSRGQSPHA